MAARLLPARLSPSLVRLAAALLALLAAPLAAQSPEKLALKAFKASQAGALKSFKVATKGMVSSLNAEVAAQEQELANGGNGFTVSVFVAEAVITLQMDLARELDEVFVDQAVAALGALADLTGPLAGVYPEGFYPGDGGAADDFRRDVEKEVAKVHAKVDKRLAKTAQKLEQAGWGFCWRLDTPRRPSAHAWSESSIGSPGDQVPTLDVVIGVSELATTTLSVIITAGSAAEADGDVTVLALGPDSDDEAGAVDSDDRFVVTLNNDSDFFPKGNYRVTVVQAPDEHTVDVTIGIR